MYYFLSVYLLGIFGGMININESVLAGYILAGVIASVGIGFYIWLSIKVYNLQK